MKLKTIKEAKIRPGFRVLIREDYNVPIGQDSRVDSQEDWRIIKSLPTIKYLINKKAKIIILSHLGRPGGRKVKSLSLKPVAKRLSFLLKKPVQFCMSWAEEKIVNSIDRLKNGQILMLENLRFNPGEEAGDKKFARQLSGYGDIYVNDAFANSHRAHASMLAITQYLPGYAGLLLAAEANQLSSLLQKPARPFVGIIGGVKISTKFPVMKTLLKKVEHLLLGGALASTVLKGMGLPIGQSVVEKEMIPQVKSLDLFGGKLTVPIDVKVCSTRKCQITGAENIKAGEKILDIGPGTIHLYKSIIISAKTIFWNGPLGLVEKKQFQKGTFELFSVLEKLKARVIIGGGETVKTLLEYDPKLIDKKNIFISTGGGAMLEFIERGTLPALKPLL